VTIASTSPASSSEAIRPAPPITHTSLPWQLRSARMNSGSGSRTGSNGGAIAAGGWVLNT